MQVLHLWILLGMVVYCTLVYMRYVLSCIAGNRANASLHCSHARSDVSAEGFVSLGGSLNWSIFYEQPVHNLLFFISFLEVEGYFLFASLYVL